jgi:anaphase-promoting complex subunit 2
VSSLLADVADEKGNKLNPGGDVSIEIAAEMQKPLPSSNEHDEDLNWNDMNWTPEPQDAGPEYRSSKNDVISYLLTLYDREDFITELKNILGEHLLKNEGSEFDKERRLLELFKLRLGDDKLQPCEVMLKDVEESKRINTLIRKNAVPPPELPTVSTQILSSFFWPPLRDDTFLVPAPIRVAQEHYARGFEAVKDMRKLRWLPALGKVDVELQLEDRVLKVECGTWQASVIYAFQQQPAEPARVGGVMRTVEQLEEMLEMDETLVRNALTYWVGERVLAPHPSTLDAFTVLERLPSSASSKDDSAAAVAAEAAKAEQNAAAGVVSSQNLLDKNRELYEQFVVGMLTNQGSMPKMRILMMLKMAVPGGFPGGAEELGGLLEGLKEKGRVVVGGGDVWGVKR